MTLRELLHQLMEIAAEPNMGLDAQIKGLRGRTRTENWLWIASDDDLAADRQKVAAHHTEYLPMDNFRVTIQIDPR
jgi:hypothetical protein